MQAGRFAGPPGGLVEHRADMQALIGAKEKRDIRAFHVVGIGLGRPEHRVGHDPRQPPLGHELDDEIALAQHQVQRLQAQPVGIDRAEMIEPAGLLQEFIDRGVCMVAAICAQAGS